MFPLQLGWVHPDQRHSDFLLWKTPQVYTSREDGTMNCCVFSIHVYQLSVHGRFRFNSIHQSPSLDSFKQIPNISVLCSPEPAEFCEEEASRDLSSWAAFLLVFFILASFVPALGVQGTASSCAFLRIQWFQSAEFSASPAFGSGYRILQSPKSFTTCSSASQTSRIWHCSFFSSIYL